MNEPMSMYFYCCESYEDNSLAGKMSGTITGITIKSTSDYFKIRDDIIKHCKKEVPGSYGWHVVCLNKLT